MTKGCLPDILLTWAFSSNQHPNRFCDKTRRFILCPLVAKLAKERLISYLFIYAVYWARNFGVKQVLGMWHVCSDGGVVLCAVTKWSCWWHAGVILTLNAAHGRAEYDSVCVGTEQLFWRRRISTKLSPKMFETIIFRENQSPNKSGSHQLFAIPDCGREVGI